MELGDGVPRLTSQLAYWINERERVRVKKEAGEEKPWSKDPVFQETYFCNVHRENDRVTKWIAENWRNPYPHPHYEIAMVLARMINKPESLKAINFPYSWDKDEYLEKFRAIDGVKWGNAYVITTHGMKMPKDEYVFELVDRMRDSSIIGIRDERTCEDAYHALRKYDGLGSFLAAQLVADFKNTEGHPLQKADDWHRFCAPGPGSLRGLSWYFGENVTNRYFHTAIRTAYRETMPHVDTHIMPIHMQDFQNCLCEFDKFCRVKSGTGRSKRRYPGK